jgi:hypothetical protein
MARIKQHEYGAYVPSMPDDERKKLKHSIATVGQILPIVIFEDEVLDGWERINVIRELRREKKYKFKPDDDDEDFVIDTSDFGYVVADFKGDHEEALQFVGAMIERKTIAPKLRLGIALKMRKELERLGESYESQVSKSAGSVGVSSRTVERAMEVEKKAIPSVTEAMEDGELPVATALKIAQKPKTKQRALMDHVEKNGNLGKLLKSKANMLDDDGNTVPKELHAVFADVPIFEGIERELTHQLKRIRELGRGPNKGVCTQSVITNMTSLINVFKSERPAYVCQKCGGSGCQRCRKAGFLRYGSGQKPKWE